MKKQKSTKTNQQKPTKPNQAFSARAGCLDYGNSYEFLLAAYYGLRLSLNKTVSDFKISVNNKDMGNFDDVVLEVEYDDGEQRLYALQLKHHNGKEGHITPSELCTEDGDFSLKKYSKGFKDSQKICENNKSYSIPFENFYFILYTNQGLKKFYNYDNKNKKGGEEIDELKLKSKTVVCRHDECVARGLINLSEKETYFIFKVRNDEEKILDEDFVKQFALYTQQKNAQDVERLISNFIFSLFDNCEVNVVINYINFFKFWWRGDFGKFKLTKRDIILKLAEYVLTPHLPEPTINPKVPKLELLKESFQNFDLVVVEDSEESQKAIWQAVLSDCLKDVDLSIWSQPFPEIRNDFFPEGTKIPISAQGENFIEQSLKKIYLVLWHMDKLPLVVKVNHKFRKAIYAAIKLSEDFQKKKKFILLDDEFDEQEFSETLKIFRKLSDLSAFGVYKKICQELNISLQGRPFLSLDDMLKIEEDLSKIVSIKEIIQMLDNNFVVGTDCRKTLPKHYVTRSIPKILLKFDAVDEVDDLFVVSLQAFQNVSFKSNKIEINKYLLMKENASFDQFSDKIVVYLEEFCTKEKFLEVCLLNPNKNCHHVKIISRSTVEWVESRGSILNLRQYQINYQDFDKQNLLQDSEALEYFTNRINVLCAAPGMGKSVLLKFFKYRCPPDYWVIKINLNDHIKFFKDKHNFEESLNYFFWYNTKDIFTKHCMSTFLSKKKILFLWDGFDELPSVCINSVLSIIKLFCEEGYKQWIAARTNSKEFLENAFGVLSATVIQFHETDQQEYIYNHLKENLVEDEKVEKMVSQLNENMTSSLSCGYFDYSGVPLHIYMIMEIFLRNPEKYTEDVKIVTLTDIYNEFIDGKFRNLYERANANKNNYLMKKIQKKFKDKQLLNYEIAALKASFEDEIFSSLNLDCENFLTKISEERDNVGLIVGLNDENKPIFTHKTYEEFLTASWLVKNYKTFPKLPLLIFENDYRNIRFMFDMILAKESPVHVAVLYRNLPLLEKYEDVQNCKDKGGRNPLQVACAWGTPHPPLKIHLSEDIKTVISAEETLDNVSDNVDIVTLLFSRGCDAFQKEDLFHWNAVDYADQTFSLALIETILSFKKEVNLTELTNFKDISTLLYYSINYNYQNLFYQINNYPYVEILEGEDTRTLLQLAIKMDRTDFVKTLLSFPHYQDVINQPFKDLSGPLYAAAFNGNLEMFKFLQENGAVLEQNQTSPLISTVALGFVNFCEKLLTEDLVDPNECSSDGNSVLQIAALRNHISIMKLLLERGADVNYANYMDHTAFDFCIENKSLEGVKLLVEYGGDVNRKGTKCYGYTALHSACEHDNEEIIKFLLESKADPTIKSNMLYTPLHVALICRQERNARILIEACPSVINEYSQENSTPLILSALENYHELIELLAKLGADLDSVKCKDSPLRVATLRKFEKSVETLIRYGADVNRPDHHGFTPLFYSIGNEKILKLYLDHPGTNVNIKSFSLVTALHFAAQNGKVYAVEGLIQRGVDINAKDFKNETPLHYAIISKEDSVLKCLLRHQAKTEDGIGLLRLACLKDAPDCLLTLLNSGVDVNVKDDQGRSALHFAAMTSLYCVKVLLLKQADINICDDLGFSPLCFAVFMGKVEIVKELLQKGADIRTGFGRSSPVHLAAGLGDIGVLVLLVSSGCDINLQDEKRRTPLHCVAERFPGDFALDLAKIKTKYQIKYNFEPNYKSCALELIERSGYISTKCINGFSPFFSAILAKNLDVIKIFFQKFSHKAELEEESQMCLFASASRDLEDNVRFLVENNITPVDVKEEKSGSTALHFACNSGSNNTASYLIRNGSDVNARTKEGLTPLHVCAGLGNLVMVRLLLEHHAEVDARNNHGNTGLFAAVAQGHLDVAIFLHEHGADINVIDDDGDVPLHDAAARGHVEVVQYLISKKAKFNHRNKEGKVPLDLARDNQKDEVVKILESVMTE